MDSLKNTSVIPNYHVILLLYIYIRVDDDKIMRGKTQINKLRGFQNNQSAGLRWLDIDDGLVHQPYVKVNNQINTSSRHLQSAVIHTNKIIHILASSGSFSQCSTWCWCLADIICKYNCTPKRRQQKTATGCSGCAKLWISDPVELLSKLNYSVEVQPSTDQHHQAIIVEK